MRLYFRHILHLICCSRASALYNAVKKQFGLHSYLLPLRLPKPSPPPVPIPAPLPRLPRPQIPELTADNMSPTPNTLNTSAGYSVPHTMCMGETDIQHTARFTREFVVMSLVPWMEKCVLEWNENVGSGNSSCVNCSIFSSSFRRLGGSHLAYFLLPAGYLVLLRHRHPRRLCRLWDQPGRRPCLQLMDGLVHHHKRAGWQSLQLSWATLN